MKKEQKNIVGQNIKKWRMARNLNQEELALNAELSQGYINQLENGKRGFSLDTLHIVADVLDIPIAVLFEEEKEKKKGVVKEHQSPYQKSEKINKKEVWRLFNSLPVQVAEHYLLLMKLEIEILGRGGQGSVRSGS